MWSKCAVCKSITASAGRVSDALVQVDWLCPDRQLLVALPEARRATVRLDGHTVQLIDDWGSGQPDQAGQAGLVVLHAGRDARADADRPADRPTGQLIERRAEESRMQFKI